MAIQIPNNLYTGGNVALDSTPSVNFYRQIEAERRAKQDAIDDYMRGLRSKVTPAGMRTADYPPSIRCGRIGKPSAYRTVINLPVTPK